MKKLIYERGLKLKGVVHMQGNTKVFAMLNEPVEQTQKFQVLFESSGMHELPVKWRNPYVLQFTVPGEPVH